MYVLALDPGGTTGFVCWGEVTGRPAIGGPGGPGVTSFGDFVDWRAVPKLVERVCRAGGPEVTVVCETFTITAQTVKKARSYEALWIIGCVKFLTDKYGSDLAMQSPAEAKGFMTDAKLRSLGWYVSNDHTRDAMRHLGLWLFKNGKLEAKDLLRGEG